MVSVELYIVQRPNPKLEELGLGGKEEYNEPRTTTLYFKPEVLSGFWQDPDNGDVMMYWVDGSSFTLPASQFEVLGSILSGEYGVEDKEDKVKE